MLGGDDATGTLTSPVFLIARPYINFLIGGGNRPGEAFIKLLVDGKPYSTATGGNDEKLIWMHWEVKNLQGKKAQIQIVDNAKGSWGHINIDQIVQSNQERGELPAQLYDETYRPQFHFSARTNWLNDPNGLVFYDGEYHLFFQHNPSGIQWGEMTWGHAVSPDLVHWKQLDHAILPDRMGTIYSGSAVVDWNNTAGFQTGKEKVLVAMYTSAERNGQKYSQCIAYSNDRGRTWTKYDKNPVLPYVAPCNRDPKLIWYAPTKQWIVTIYLTGQDYALFTSPDLKSFTRLQNVPPFGNAECPDFYPMPVDGNAAQIKWVFSGANGRYVTGDFDGHKFVLDSQHSQPMDWGKNYYAAQTYSDIPASDGRRIQIAWMNGGVYPKMPFNQQMSFPTELKLQRFPEGLRICRTPVREIELLHSDPHEWHDLTVKPGENPLADIHGDLFEIRAEIEPGDATEVGFNIRGHQVACHIADQKLTCLGGIAPMPLVNKRLTLQILVDRSSLEVFANNGYVAMTSCFVPDPKTASLSFTPWAVMPNSSTCKRLRFDPRGKTNFRNRQIGLSFLKELSVIPTKSRIAFGSALVCLILVGSTMPTIQADNGTFVKIYAEKVGQTAAVNLRCEYLSNPLGMHETAPRLSWMIQSPTRGQLQTAYQILVASSPEKLAKDQGDLWDSGKVASDESGHVVYAGQPLVSREAAYWKVQIWDGSAKPSGYSAPALWTEGLLKPEDWHAKWIGAEEADTLPEVKNPVKIIHAVYEATDGTAARDVTRLLVSHLKRGRLSFNVSNEALGGDPALNHIKQLKVKYTFEGKAATATCDENDRLILPGAGSAVRYLRKTFTTDKAVRSATLYATALGLYELDLNGQRVGDHVLAPDWTDYRKRKVQLPGVRCHGTDQQWPKRPGRVDRQRLVCRPHWQRRLSDVGQKACPHGATGSDVYRWHRAKHRYR